MNKIKIKTPSYSLVACDLSAAEVRTSANAAQDPDMIDAYMQGKDLYSVVASKIYNNKYEDNLEFYPEGTKIIYEGKEVICGNEKEHFEEFNDNAITVKDYMLVDTKDGLIEAGELKVGDTLITDEGNFSIKSVSNIDSLITIRV